MPFSLFSEQDVYLFREGTHLRLYEKFGVHEVNLGGESGFYFAVWAPNALEVSVIGDFNEWNPAENKLFPRLDSSGIWEGFISGVHFGNLYKYAIRTAQNVVLEKADPFGFSMEQNRNAATVIADTWYVWRDKKWMSARHKINTLSAPVAVYEVHLGSWMRDDDEQLLNYRQIAEKLIPYLREMKFTHVEFMPVAEYPYDPSWGYQITGFFAATSRFGSPQDLMFLIDALHESGFGVILDWVPSHFPGDANGLHLFDGTFLYQHEDRRKGFHPEWNSYLFNYGRGEVRSFLISNAIFWLDRYHIDGFRVDAVTSMLHLDYARSEGEWEPNIFGGNVNLEAQEFLRAFNESVHREFPGILTIAEESSDFPMLTKPVAHGGIGFDMKWMMGWMHDTLKYFSQDPLFRKYFHHKLTFASMYVYNERYIMPLSHDEVVHGKASLIYKMPGGEWQKFANLRALYVYMYTQPGAKLLFMGNEFAQTGEWNFTKSLDWGLLQHAVHRGMQRLVKDLNTLYQKEKALFELNFSPEGFEWVQADDAEDSVYIYLRKGTSEKNNLMVVLNLTPRVLEYKLKQSAVFTYEPVLNSDDTRYAGSGISTEILAGNEQVLKLPPLSGVIYRQLKHKQIAAKKKKPSNETGLNK